jgi:hypothetical protein
VYGLLEPVAAVLAGSAIVVVASSSSYLTEKAEIAIHAGGCNVDLPQAEGSTGDRPSSTEER